MTLTDHKGERRIVSWPVLFVGALIAFALSFLLNILNTGLGLALLPTDTSSFTPIAVGGFIWLILSGIAVMFLSGWITGRLLRQYNASPLHGFLHGFLAWALALILTLVIASHFVGLGVQGLSDNIVMDQTTPAAAATTAVTSAAAQAQKAEAAKAAEKTGNVIGGATIGIFFVFLLGALAAATGGYFGSKKD